MQGMALLPPLPQEHQGRGLGGRGADLAGGTLLGAASRRALGPPMGTGSWGGHSQNGGLQARGHVRWGNHSPPCRGYFHPPPPQRCLHPATWPRHPQPYLPSAHLCSWQSPTEAAATRRLCAAGWREWGSQPDPAIAPPARPWVSAHLLRAPSLPVPQPCPASATPSTPRGGGGPSSCFRRERAGQGNPANKGRARKCPHALAQHSCPPSPVLHSPPFRKGSRGN